MKDKKINFSKDTLIKEMNGLREKAKKASNELDAARVTFERHVGALEAMQCLLSAYFPDDKSEEQQASESVSVPPK